MNYRSPVPWTLQLEKKFQQTCAAFASYTFLHFLKNDAELRLYCDASNVAVGAVLEQIFGNERQLLGFYSSKLDPKQQLWCTYDRELYAVYAAVEHFSHLLEGRVFTISTDHKPLVYMFESKARIKLERRLRWIEYISLFTTEICHTSGVTNVIADALSTPEESINEIEAAATSLPTRISEEHKMDKEIKKIREDGYRDHMLQKVVMDAEIGASILCSKFRGILRPVLPKKCAAKFLNYFMKRITQEKKLLYSKLEIDISGQR